MSSYYKCYPQATDLNFVDLFDPVLLVSHQLREGGEDRTKLRLKGGVFVLASALGTQIYYQLLHTDL